MKIAKYINILLMGTICTSAWAEQISYEKCSAKCGNNEFVNWYKVVLPSEEYNVCTRISVNNPILLILQMLGSSVFQPICTQDAQGDLQNACEMYSNNIGPVTCKVYSVD